MPLFSVVIPTCDRAHLLSSALESVLADQRFDDYEVVVSDNFSSDGTAEMVERFASSRLRYVRTERRLSMADHWEFALSHARGDYVSYLCDDDAWTPQVLQEVASALGREERLLVGMFRGRYFSANCSWPGWANSLAVTPFTGKVLERESRSSLQELFQYQETLRMPKMFNSFCHRGLLQSAKKRWGRLFLPWCPDYSFPAIVLTETESWTLIDRPLWLRYYGTESIGAGARDHRGGSFEQFLKEHGANGLPRKTPLAIPISTNYAVDTLLEVKELNPEKFKGIDVDWERYFVTCWKELRIQELAGTDVGSDQKLFFEALEARGAEVATRVRDAIEALIYDEKHHILVRRTPLSLLAKAFGGFALPATSYRLVHGAWLRLRGLNPGIVVRGTEGGFTGILDCARRIDQLIG